MSKVVVVMRQVIARVELFGVFTDEQKAIEAVGNDIAEEENGVRYEVEIIDDEPDRVEIINEEQEGWKVISIPSIGEVWGYMITDTIQ